MANDTSVVVEVIKAIPVIILGCITVYIAWRQSNISHQGLIAQMFDRKVAVYGDVIAVVDRIMIEARADMNDVIDMNRVIARARFLFESDVTDYLIALKKAVVTLATVRDELKDEPAGPKRTALAKKSGDALREVSVAYEVLSDLIKPYVRVQARAKG